MNKCMWDWHIYSHKYVFSGQWIEIELHSGLWLTLLIRRFITLHVGETDAFDPYIFVSLSFLQILVAMYNDRLYITLFNHVIYSDRQVIIGAVHSAGDRNW